MKRRGFFAVLLGGIAAALMPWKSKAECEVAEEIDIQYVDMRGNLHMKDRGGMRYWIEQNKQVDSGLTFRGERVYWNRPAYEPEQWYTSKPASEDDWKNDTPNQKG